MLWIMSFVCIYHLFSWNYVHIHDKIDHHTKPHCFAIYINMTRIYNIIFFFLGEKIDGKIEAPKMVRDWGSKKSECWLCFERVTGLVLKGSGLLDSHGETWWPSVGYRPQVCRWSYSTCWFEVMHYYKFTTFVSFEGFKNIDIYIYIYY